MPGIHCVQDTIEGQTLSRKLEPLSRCQVYMVYKTQLGCKPWVENWNHYHFARHTWYTRHN